MAYFFYWLLLKTTLRLFKCYPSLVMWNKEGRNHFTNCFSSSLTRSSEAPWGRGLHAPLQAGWHRDLSRTKHHGPAPHPQTAPFVSQQTHYHKIPANLGAPQGAREWVGVLSPWCQSSCQGWGLGGGSRSGHL